MDTDNLKNLCKQLSKQAVTKITPQEVRFFDIVWDALAQRIFQRNKVLSPKDWRIVSSQTNDVKGIGLHGGEDLQMTSIISTLTSIVVAMASSENRSQKVLDEFTLKYATDFGTPQWAIPHIKSLVQKRLKELPISMRHKKVYAKPYLIWETGQSRHDGTKEDVKSLREAAIKGKFDIYANDTEDGELLVFGKQTKLDTGETFAWATLLALLERVGSRWTRQELFERIRPNEVYKRTPHSQYVYQWIRHVKESMKEAISRTNKQGVEKIVDSWFQTGERNRVNISANLKACLVRKNPAANL